LTGEPGGPAGAPSTDLALIAARFGAALRRAGVPADPGRCARFAAAVTVARPRTRRELYLCALATLVSGQAQLEPMQRVFGEFFGGAGAAPVPGAAPDLPRPGLPGPEELLAGAARQARAHLPPPPPGPDRPPPGGPAPEGLDGAGDAAAARAEDRGPGGPEPDGDPGRLRRALASPAERLAERDFAELTPAELASLSGLMRELTLALPLRRARRQRRTPHGRRTDLRSTLRQARRTGGHPLRLARQAPGVRPRQLIVLCDISGSMEPYARAMLQFLYCAAGGAQAEVYTFATRLTRLTGALAHLPAGQALQRAGQAAPDWHGGTRIGAALREFNDSRGRAGLARGAVVVIISDGWDTGDPAVVRREMQRLSRVAHRIIWVNPRTKSADYQPLAGGMAAAWPFCDAVVSAHSLHALADLTAALGRPARYRPWSRDGSRRPPYRAAPDRPTH
jgi:uncharacterized protein with von Willebrand factor type A (vWA) domain